MLLLLTLIYTIHAQLVLNSNLAGRSRTGNARLSGNAQDIRITVPSLTPNASYFLFLSEPVANGVCNISDTVTSTDFSGSRGVANFNLKLANATLQNLIGLRLVVWSTATDVMCGIVQPQPPPASPTATTSTTATNSLDNPNLLPPGYTPGQKQKIEDANLPPIDPNYINPAIKSPTTSSACSLNGLLKRALVFLVLLICL